MKIKTHDYLYLLFIITLIILFFKIHTLNVDSTWILYVASQIVEGKTLYIDISEVNPPLIFLYSSIAIYISKITFFSNIESYIILISILILISICLSFFILKRTSTTKENIRYYIYLITFILIISTLPAYGQREHLLIIFTLPYIIFSMFRDKIILQNYMLLIIVVFASLGLNLKPHFFILIITIELIYIFHFKRIFYFIRWDSLLIFFSGVIYLLLIFLEFPEYINFAIPLAIETYTSLFNKPFSILLLNYEVFIFLLGIFIWLIFTKKEFNLDIKVLFITILSFLLIYFLQQKGWFYHRLPFFLLTILFVFHIILTYINKNQRIYFLSLVPLIGIIILLNIQRVPNFIELKDILKNLPKYSKIHIISTDIARGQTLLVQNKQKWASRFGALGILPSILRNQNQKTKKYLLDSLYEDLIEYKPDTIIFCGKYSRFNYYQYFSSVDKRLNNIYNFYYNKSIINGYTVLKKNKEFR